jgi:hypothetical protein
MRDLIGLSAPQFSIKDLNFVTSLLYIGLTHLPALQATFSFSQFLN